MKRISLEKQYFGFTLAILSKAQKIYELGAKDKSLYYYCEDCQMEEMNTLKTKGTLREQFRIFDELEMIALITTTASITYKEDCAPTEYTIDYDKETGFFDIEVFYTPMES